MMPQKTTYVIWDNVAKDIILYYPDNTGNKTKAIFTNKQLAKDAVRNIAENQHKSIHDLQICIINQLEPSI